VKNVRYSRTCGRKCAAALRVIIGINGNHERQSWQSKLQTWVKKVNREYQERKGRCPQCDRLSGNKSHRCQRCCEIISYKTIVRIRQQVREIKSRFNKQCCFCQSVAEFNSRSCIACKRQRVKETKVKGHRSRCLKYGGQFDQGVTIDAIAIRDGIDCNYCGVKTTLWNGCWTETITTIDHVIPLSKMGDHTMGNVVIACGKCNSKKKDNIETLF
jgi:hypothetical protein